VTGLRLRNTATQDESVLSVSAHVPGDRHIPNAAMFKGLIDLDADGYINDHGPGVHQGAWSVRLRRRPGSAVRQAITAAGSGCMAALEVEKIS